MSHRLHILLLRHGQTDANATGVLQGHQPTPLNALGIRQATLLASRLASRHPPVEVLVSSDLRRAAQTAGAIAAACRLDVTFDAAWRERSFGLLEGKPVGTRDTWRAASGEIDPPGAEPLNSFATRIEQALINLRKLHPKARVIAVVTHGGPIRMILRLLAEERLHRVGKHSTDVAEIANCGILHLVARHVGDKPLWMITCINEVSHLMDEERTGQDSG